MASRLPVISIDAMAGIARHDGADARVDAVAQPLHESGCPVERTGLGRRRDHLDGAAHEAGRADALEIKVAGENVTAGLERLQRRIKQRLDLDKAAGGRRHATLDRKPHALRPLLDTPGLDALDPHHHPVGVLALLARNSTKPVTVTPEAAKRSTG
jgi:hypothetical protein